MVAYTGNLRLTKQDTGSNENTWGEVVNGLLDLLDRAVAGAVEVDLTAAGDYILSAANGMEDQARYAALLLVGSPTAAKNVIIPGVSKIYFVRNSTDYDISVGPVDGTAGVVAPDELAILFCDGVNAVKYLPTVGEDNIVDSAISTDKIQDEAVTGAKIAPETIEDGNITEESLTGRVIADESLPERVFEDESVSERVYRTGSISRRTLNYSVKSAMNNTGLRQCILQASRDEEGLANYLTPNPGLTAFLHAAVPFTFTIQDGFLETGEVDRTFTLAESVTWDLPNNTAGIRLCLELDITTLTVTPFFTTAAPLIRAEPPVAGSAEGQLFIPQLDRVRPRRWNGSEWVEGHFIEVATVTTSGGNVSSVGGLFIRKDPVKALLSLANPPLATALNSAILSGSAGAGVERAVFKLRKPGRVRVSYQYRKVSGPNAAALAFRIRHGTTSVVSNSTNQGSWSTFDGYVNFTGVSSTYNVQMEGNGNGEIRNLRIYTSIEDVELMYPFTIPSA